MTNVQFNIVRSQKYQDRKAIIIDSSKSANESIQHTLAESRINHPKFGSSTYKSKIVEMHPIKDSDYGNQAATSLSIDRTLAGHHNHVNLHNFRKTQNLTLRLNQRPQRLDHIAHKQRNPVNAAQGTNG